MKKTVFCNLSFYYFCLKKRKNKFMVLEFANWEILVDVDAYINYPVREILVKMILMAYSFER